MITKPICRMNKIKIIYKSNPMAKTILFAAILSLSSTCSAFQFPREIEIGGSILDRGGNLFTDEVALEVELGAVDSKKRVVLDEAYLALINVKEMFEVYNTRYTFVVGDQEGPTDQGDGLLRYKVIREQEGYGSRFPGNPDRIIIWNHGYNNTVQQSP